MVMVESIVLEKKYFRLDSKVSVMKRSRICLKALALLKNHLENKELLSVLISSRYVSLVTDPFLV